LEPHALFKLEQPDEMGCVWATSWAGAEVWQHNLGPVAKVRELLAQWLAETRLPDDPGDDRL
jgi:hypothetical protein